jgi:hypothetical protein
MGQPLGIDSNVAFDSRSLYGIDRELPSGTPIEDFS